MTKGKLPNIPKVPARWKSGVVVFAALFATAAFEEIKQVRFGKLTPWESHTVTLVYCATLTLLLRAVFFRREEARVREHAALNESLMEGLPGVVCVFDSSGKIRREHEFSRLLCRGDDENGDHQHSCSGKPGRRAAND